MFQRLPLHCFLKIFSSIFLCRVNISFKVWKIIKCILFFSLIFSILLFYCWLAYGILFLSVQFYTFQYTSTSTNWFVKFVQNVWFLDATHDIICKFSTFPFILLWIFFGLFNYAYIIFHQSGLHFPLELSFIIKYIWCLQFSFIFNHQLLASGIHSLFVFSRDFWGELFVCSFYNWKILVEYKIFGSTFIFLRIF